MSKLNNVITLRVDRLTVERQCTQRLDHLGTGNHIYKLLTLKIHNFEVWSGIGELQAQSNQCTPMLKIHETTDLR